VDLTKLIKTRATDFSSKGRPLHIAFGTTEVLPFSKTGGLADVAASLPKALANRGHRVAIITPLYKHIDTDEHQMAQRLTVLEVPRKAKSQKKIEVNVWEKRLAQGVDVYFLECDEYFDRDGLYGYDDNDFEDNAQRFAFFSRALVEFCLQMSTPVDVLHLNDWHTALAPVYRNYYYDDELAVPTVLTLHNIAFQGRFPVDDFDATGLPKGTFLDDKELKDGDDIVFLKAGIKHADAVTTVSPTHAEEIRSEEGGFGLDAELRERGDNLRGILNGADYSIWSPETDQYIPIRYDLETLNGKRRDKADLQHSLGLPVRPTLALLGFVGRLTEQKGLDVLIPALRKLLRDLESEREGFQVVIMGEGEQRFQKALEKLQTEFPTRVAFREGYNEELAHKVIAGSDILLVPSRFEPCGLTQIYAMKYGTLPVVHATGGLVDTVKDAEADNGTGFVFDKLTKAQVAKAITRATDKYKHHRQWRPLIMKAMEADFSWARSAAEYEELYYETLEAKGLPTGIPDPAEDTPEPSTDSEPADDAAGTSATEADAVEEKTEAKPKKKSRSRGRKSAKGSKKSESNDD
jgi:starch synthase